MTTLATSSDPAAVLDAGQRLADRGDWAAAVELLQAANRRAPDRRLEERLVRLRHRAFAALDVPEIEPSWPHARPDAFAGAAGIPEIPADDVDAEALGSALQHHGSLLVRGLLDAEVAGSLRADVVRAFDASAAFHDGASAEDTSPYFLPFEADPGYSFGFFEQSAARLGGGVLLAESPRLLFRVVEEYRRTRLGDMLAAYLGEWPALSVKKSTLRRASRESGRGWHQDGRFLGPGVHTVNVWTALTRCGVDAPSVDVFAAPFDHIVVTGTPGADHSWSVSREVAASYGLEHVVRPVFAPGDALLFNQMTLHETGIGDHMTEVRYAIEMWFFGPSTYPHDQVPLVF
jgi:hypothetical protein